jgi:hypothetical protein
LDAGALGFNVPLRAAQAGEVTECPFSGVLST